MTESYTAKKDHPGGHGPSPPKTEELQRAPAEESHKEENAGENAAIQTTGPWAVDLERNSTTSDESDKPRR